MNYIPGFNQHLQQFARGGRARFDQEMIYDADQFEQPMMFDADQQYVDPNATYFAPAEQPYVAPYTAPAAAPTETPYIPGFSNYLETSAAPVETAAPAAAFTDAPVDISKLDFSGIDLSGLDSLYGMNFGSNFGGGPMGGIYPNDPNLQYIGAPTSNKGNATSQTGGNTFTMTPDQPVRLVDHRTNQVVFEGTGYDAARKATELGQGLTDQFGRKANYSIQTADPAGNYSTVAYEKKNKSTLGTIADIAGTALPLAALAIPGLNVAAGKLLGSKLLGSVALGTALGGAGAGLKGDNILKGAALGGLGAAGGAVLGPALGNATGMSSGLARAVGTGIGSAAGNLATGASLENSLLSGALSGGLSYIAPNIQQALGGSGQGVNFDAGGDGTVSLSGSGPAPIVVSGYTTPSIGLSVGSASPHTSTTEPKPLDMAGGQVVSGVNAPVDTGALSTLANTSLSPTVDSNVINVLGNPLTSGTGINIGGSGLSTVNATDLGRTTDTVLDEPTTDGTKKDDTITVTGGQTLPSVNVPIGTNTSSVSDVNLEPLTDGTKDDEIVVTGGKTIPGVAAPFGSPDLDPIDLTKTDLTEDPNKRPKLGVEEYLRLASLAAGLLDGGGGKGSPGTYGGGGSGRLNPIFSAKLPDVSGFAARKPRDVSGVDFKTYGYRPGIRFFDDGAPINYGSPPPSTTPVPNDTTGPAMYAPDVDDVRFARGGALEAKRGGSSERTEFAVNGPGTGRSDDIPAVLSDGEYVIDAETVALLGDGSSKAGAKKLDDLRVKVRKHKGKKLAKGRFSANAKKPEAYLSGGRI